MVTQIVEFKIKFMLSLFRILIICLYGFIMISCKESKSSKKILETATKSENIGIKIDSINIPVNSGLYQYNISSTTCSNKEILYFGYDSKQHTLSVINLNKKKVVKTTLLSREGPQGIDEISNMYCQSKDSIFACGLNNLFVYLLNSNGDIIKKWPINDRDTQNEQFYIHNVFSSNPDPFFYNKFDNSLYLRNYYYDVSPTTQPTKYYKNAHILGKLDLNGLRPEILNVEYPLMLKNNYGGFLVDPSFTFVKEEGVIRDIIYTFPCSANIFSYDINSESTTLFKPSSRPIKMHIDFLPWSASNNTERKLQAVNSDVMYGKVFQINYRGNKYFLQFCFDKPKNINGELGRKVFSLIYDKSFNLIHNREMTNFSANYLSAFCQNNTVYIPQLKDESEISFLKLSLK